MTDFVAAVKDSSITMTCMTAEQVVHREHDLHLEDILKEAKAIKGITDFHCFEWRGEVGAAEATTGSTASTEIGHWYAVYWCNNDY